MKELKDLLSKNIKRAGIAYQVEMALVLERFDRIVIEIFGSRILEKAKPLHLKDKIITVACLSSAVAQELKLNEAKIIEEINLYFGKRIVEGLRFIT